MIGRALFTDFVVPFELAAVLLLIALSRARSSSPCATTDERSRAEMVVPLTYPLALAADIVRYRIVRRADTAQRHSHPHGRRVDVERGQHQPHSFCVLLDGAAATGQIFALFIMTVSAAEVALALAIILILAKREKHIDIERVNLLRW